MRVENHFDIRIADHLDGAPLRCAAEFDNDDDSRLDGKNSDRRSQFFPYAVAVGISLLAHVAAVTGMWFASGFLQPAIEPRVSVGQAISIGLVKKNPLATSKLPAPEPADKDGADERLDGDFQPSPELLSLPTSPALTAESHVLSPAALIPAPLITQSSMCWLRETRIKRKRAFSCPLRRRLAGCLLLSSKREIGAGGSVAAPNRKNAQS